MRSVTDIIGRELYFECEACGIANHQILPACKAIFSDDKVEIYCSLNVPLLGFIVIAPKEHVSSFDALDEQTNETLVNLTMHVIEGLKKYEVSEEFSVIKREGDEHACYWVMPRLGGIFEQDFDFSLLDNKDSMVIRNIPIAQPSEILLLTVRMRNYFNGLCNHLSVV